MMLVCCSLSYVQHNNKSYKNSIFNATTIPHFFFFFLLKSKQWKKLPVRARAENAAIKRLPNPITLAGHWKKVKVLSVETCSILFGLKLKEYKKSTSKLPPSGCGYVVLNIPGGGEWLGYPQFSRVKHFKWKLTLDLLWSNISRTCWQYCLKCAELRWRQFSLSFFERKDFHLSQSFVRAKLFNLKCITFFYPVIVICQHRERSSTYN